MQLSSSNFDLEANNAGDSREGLDPEGAAEVQRIMREEGCSFDEVRFFSSLRTALFWKGWMGSICASRVLPAVDQTEQADPTSPLPTGSTATTPKDPRKKRSRRNRHANGLEGHHFALPLRDVLRLDGPRQPPSSPSHLQLDRPIFCLFRVSTLRFLL